MAIDMLFVYDKFAVIIRVLVYNFIRVLANIKF